MIIRPAESHDATAIATIHVRSWQHAYRDLLPADRLASLSIEDRVEQWQHLLDSPHPGETLVAEIDSAVVGFARWGLMPDTQPITAMLYSIYLLPTTMGKGVGSALLRKAEAGMTTTHAGIGRLHVLRDNAPTRAFYERHGWQLVPGSEDIERFYGIDVETMAYQKTLS